MKKKKRLVKTELLPLTVVLTDDCERDRVDLVRYTTRAKNLRKEQKTLVNV